ncbi:hypothetical protein OKW47_002219 [Paraburkholderia atlantica]
MARWHIRCSRDKCRARHTLPKHPDEYKRGWKCRACGCERYTIIKDIIKHSGHVDCNCGAFIWTGSTGNYECTTHRRGSRACWFNRDGTPREPDPYGRADYVCTHNGLPCWPAIYCSEETRPRYSRWHFGWQATQAARSASDAALGRSRGDPCDVPESEVALEIDG